MVDPLSYVKRFVKYEIFLKTRLVNDDVCDR